MSWTRRQWSLTALGAAVGCSQPDAGEAPASPPETLLARSYVIDLHCDTPMRIKREGFDLGVRNDYGQVDIPRMREGGATALFFSVYCPADSGRTPQKFQEAQEIIASVRAEVARHPEDLVMAASSTQIVAAKTAGKIAILLGVEGGHMIDSSLENLVELHQQGARYMTLTHSRHTPWAGSSGGDAADDPGLTEFGGEVVAEMNRLGMMVDLSHVSDKTFNQAIEAAGAPVIASHSSCRALAAHPRNMTDAMIRAVAENGGVVHINYFNGFLDANYRKRAAAATQFAEALKVARRESADNPTELAAAEWRIAMEKITAVGRVPMSVLLDHFEHAVKVGGVEHVGLGSDFDGVSEELPEGMEDVSKTPNLIAGLRSRGLADSAIEKILGGNTLRVMREVEARAENNASATTA